MDNDAFSFLRTEHQLTNFLWIDTTNVNSDIHKILYFGDDDSSKFTGSPINSGPFYGYRIVRCNATSKTAQHLITVELHEQYPVNGRVWVNTYDVGVVCWYGWKVLNPNGINELLVQKFTRDSVTFTPYGYVDVPISVPAGYFYISCLGGHATGAVVNTYVEYATNTSYVRFWHPENFTSTCSLDAYVLFARI